MMRFKSFSDYLRFLRLFILITIYFRKSYKTFVATTIVHQSAKWDKTLLESSFMPFYNETFCNYFLLSSLPSYKLLKWLYSHFNWCIRSLIPKLIHLYVAVADTV